MSFLAERTEFERELDTYYGAYPSDVTSMREHIDEASACHPSWLPYRRKALLYETIASQCRVKVFRHLPFYFEVDTGRARDDLGAGGLGGWLKGQPQGERLRREGEAWWAPCSKSGLSSGWSVLDDNHHCIGNDVVFQHGLSGLLEKVDRRLGRAKDEGEETLLAAMRIGLLSLCTVANRFSEEAARLADLEADPNARERFLLIADAAARVPARAPATFYEALNTLLFMREVTQSMEGNGVSTLGHLDRILAPYYESDLAEGRLTREDAKDLLRFFLAFSDARFGMREEKTHVGTNTTVVIGGCDARGTPIFNDVTRLVVEVYRELRLVDPKLNARISESHGKGYLDLLAGLMAEGSKAVCVFNDDIIIPANGRMGKTVEDCRLYVAGGCQENVLENTEINSRATVYLNLLQVLLMGFFPERWRFFTEREALSLDTYGQCATYDAFYGVCLRNLTTVLDAHVDQRNRTEQEGWRFNPCPLHSTTIRDCIDNARDMMEGGARYSYGSVSLTGVATFIDSLYAVREVVYERKLVSLGALCTMLDNNFDGAEPFRQYLVNRTPKFGQEDDAIQVFSAKVFEDLAEASSGRKNARGGRYEASLFSFRTFVDFGERTGATPDGRRAGDYLSPGMGPSRLSLGAQCRITRVLGALEPLDLVQFPVAAVLDLKLPLSSVGPRPDVLSPVIKRFLDCGGSVLQVNCVDQRVLLEARAHPERHPDLVVRISGYSAYYTSLPERVQDEVIERSVVLA